MFKKENALRSLFQPIDKALQALSMGFSVRKNSANRAIFPQIQRMNR